MKRKRYVVEATLPRWAYVIALRLGARRSVLDVLRDQIVNDVPNVSGCARDGKRCVPNEWHEDGGKVCGECGHKSF